jgi:hypothetical protein
MESESIEKHGNPYFVTLNGSSYTFRGKGEYTLLSLPEFNGQEVQVRLASNNDDSNMDKTVGIVAFAIGFFHAKKRVQFELFPAHQLLEIRIDTRLIELPHEEFAVSVLIYEDEHVRIKRIVNGTFKISFAGSHFQFRAHIRPTFDFFDLETLLERDKFSKLSTPSYGLLGDLHGLRFPNGTRISINESEENTLFEYGESWRVLRNTSLFYYLYDDIGHHRPSLPVKQILEETNKTSLVQQSCIDDASLQHCTKDVSTSDSEVLSVADMHRFHHSDQHHWESLTVTIEPDILPQKKLNSASSHRYSYSRFLLLLLYFLI